MRTIKVRTNPCLENPIPLINHQLKINFATGKKRESKSFMPQLQTASNDASPKDYRIKKVEYYRAKIKSEVKKAIDGVLLDDRLPGRL